MQENANYIHQIHEKISKPQYYLDTQTDSNKNQMHSSIKSKNLQKVIRLIKVFGFNVHEECSVKGYYWNTLHYACHFQSDQILEYLIKTVYKQYPTQYIKIINEKTCEGYTPLMIAVIYGSTKCLEILLKAGGINLYQEDNQGRNIKDLADLYERQDHISMVNAEIGKFNRGQSYTKLNTEFLQQLSEIEDVELSANSNIIYMQCSDEGIEDKDDHHELLLNGERRDCMICLSNLGYVKYTTCCGQPMHALCKRPKIKNCPNCKSIFWDLTSEVVYPERAFCNENI